MLFRSSLWLGCALAALGLVVGCGGSPSDSGSLALELVLADGAEIDRVDWRISGNGMAPMEGSIDTSAQGATASVEVFGLPPGQGYLLEMDATSNDGLTTCEGSMNFNVSVGQVTEAFVMLQCRRAPDSGGVRVETEVNLCGELIKVVVSPLQTSIGNDIDLSAEAVDGDGGPIAYFWSASGGSIANPNSPDTTYTCGQVGQQFVRIQIADSDSCVDEYTVPVRCVDGGGTGGTGGSGPECQTCGIGNDIPFGPTSTATFNCSVMGIPIPIDFALTAVSQGSIVPGDNVITTGFETIIPVDVVNLILALADEATVTDTLGRVATSASPGGVDLRLTPVPCLVCFFRDTPAVVPNDPRTDVYTVTGDSAAFQLNEVTLLLNAAGLPLTLSNVGPNPACAWEGGQPPRVNLGSGGVGGFGGGGTGIGACINEDDAAVYETAEYTNAFGQQFLGIEAPAQAARDCVLGSPALVSDGCGVEVGQVLANNTPTNRNALGRCVDQCTEDQGFPLSEDCLRCYGDTVTCGAAFCPGPCAPSVNTEVCQRCGCEANCFRDFELCTGFLPDGSCDLGPGGSGGGPGGGGTGGDGSCQQTCGVGNEFPDGSPVATADLNCSVMGIPIPLSFNFTALSAGAIADGDNDITAAAQTIIPEDVVDLILALADQATILSTDGGVETSGSPARLSLLLTRTPCEVCFSEGTPVEVTLDPRTETFQVSGGAIDLDLADVTVIIDAAGLQLVLSTIGDDPACAWSGAAPGVTLMEPIP